MAALSISSVPAPITRALKNASTATGTDFDYLLKTAIRESSLKPSAKATTSSAAGLFQFIEQTWLGTLKAAGPKYGLQSVSNAISRDARGRYFVSDPAKRSAILALRFDPKLSALMAGEFTRSNARTLEARTGRPPSQGELYIGHFLGAAKAARLINTARYAPATNASLAFPKAAKANRAIFYDKNGKARSVAEVYRQLTRRHDRGIARFAPPGEGTATDTNRRHVIRSLPVGQPASAVKNTATAPRRVETRHIEGPMRPLTHALFTIWRTPLDDPQAGKAVKVFRSLFSNMPQAGAAAKPAEPDRPRPVRSVHMPNPATGTATSRHDRTTALAARSRNLPSLDGFLAAFGLAETARSGEPPRRARAEPSTAPARPPEGKASPGIHTAWGRGFFRSAPATGRSMPLRAPGAI